jgi:site-specific recombinase
MQAYPEFREAMHQYLVMLFVQKKPLRLYTESGIDNTLTFGTEVRQKIAYKLLPPVSDTNELRTTLNMVFRKQTDYQWVKQVPDELWIELLQSMGFLSETSPLRVDPLITNGLLNAVQVLAQRITAIGLENEIVDKLPSVEELKSPFFGLSREVNAYVDKFRENPGYRYINEEDYRQILVMLRQCQESILFLRKNKHKYGVSLHLTQLIIRLDQHIGRLKSLLAIIQQNQPEERNMNLISLFKSLVEAENTKYQLGRYLSDNLSMLSFKIVEHTSQTGEHYIARNKAEYKLLWRSALGGGIVVAFLVCVKTMTYYLHAPKFWEAFLYSMNYSVGFILIHILHFTLATKQPAMTASTIAQALDYRGGKSLYETAVMITQLIRSQTISLLGNVAGALPTAYLLAWVFFIATGDHIAKPEKALYMIEELHPWQSLSLLFAAIAGVYLMAAGLISGLHDNNVVYRRIPDRIRHQPLLQRLLPANWLDRFATYIEQNLGGLAGNFYLGIFLGSTSAIGFLLGLPLDIRHVTFAAGGFGLGFAGLHHQLNWEQIFFTWLGIFGIGLVNVLVSFGLSMLVAVKSRRISFRQFRELLYWLTVCFVTNPGSFFYPPPEESRASESITH